MTLKLGPTIIAAYGTTSVDAISNCSLTATRRPRSHRGSWPRSPTCRARQRVVVSRMNSVSLQGSGCTTGRVLTRLWIEFISDWRSLSKRIQTSCGRLIQNVQRLP